MNGLGWDLPVVAGPQKNLQRSFEQILLTLNPNPLSPNAQRTFPLPCSYPFSTSFKSPDSPGRFQSLGAQILPPVYL